MALGTFANIRLVNKFLSKPWSANHPSGQTLDIFDAAELYQKENVPVCILAGVMYGSGSSRDWVAKGCLDVGPGIIITDHGSNLLKTLKDNPIKHIVVISPGRHQDNLTETGNKIDNKHLSSNYFYNMNQKIITH